MAQSSTIVALSSGSLPSGVAVIRLSGPQALAVVEAISGALPAPRTMALRNLTDPDTGARLDRGLVAVFPGPHSFTGEDCAELQVHGSPAGVRAIIGVLTRRADVRLAGAGEFTRQAFENGKLDLTAIEGLGDLLNAETESQRKQALARLEGGLTARIEDWRIGLIGLRAEIEAHLDFADEDDVPIALPDDFGAQIVSLAAELKDGAASYGAGRIVREGLRVVLAGAPNAGKSSLLNVLAGSDLAIVTEQAGTTRDTKDVAIDIGGHLVTLTDTAGLRDSADIVEQEGVRRAKSAMERADLVLWLVAPDAEASPPPQLQGVPVWTIATKADLGHKTVKADLAISSKTGAGTKDLISRLARHIEASLGAAETSLVSHMRDRDALIDAADLIEQARDNLDRPELCADLLRQATDRLGRLTGLIDSEMVLDRLFAGFCIGK